MVVSQTEHSKYTNEIFWTHGDFYESRKSQLREISVVVLFKKLTISFQNWIDIDISSILILHYNIIDYIIIFTSRCNILTCSRFYQKLFQCHVHHYQYLVVPVELAAMEFVFQFTVFGIGEMLVWMACVIVSKSVWVL